MQIPRSSNNILKSIPLKLELFEFSLNLTNENFTHKWGSKINLSICSFCKLAVSETCYVGENWGTFTDPFSWFFGYNTGVLVFASSFWAQNTERFTSRRFNQAPWNVPIWKRRLRWRDVGEFLPFKNQILEIISHTPRVFDLPSFTPSAILARRNSTHSTFISRFSFRPELIRSRRAFPAAT